MDQTQTLDTTDVKHVSSISKNFFSGGQKKKCFAIYKCFQIIQPTFKVFQMPRVIEAV